MSQREPTPVEIVLEPRPWSIRRALKHLLELDAVMGLPGPKALAVADNMLRIASQEEDERAAVAAAALIMAQTEVPVMLDGADEQAKPQGSIILRGKIEREPMLPEEVSDQEDDDARTEVA